MSEPNLVPVQDQTAAVVVQGSACGWWQRPDGQGSCRLSGLAVTQTVFNIPAQIMGAQLVLLPAGLVPVAGLAVNVAVWYFVGRWALGLVKGRGR